MNEVNLWDRVGNKCLEMSIRALDGETVPTAATVETVEKLVGIAISIDELNLRWELKNLSGAAAFRGLTFSQQEAKS